MADRRKKSWGRFKNKMKAKRCKTGGSSVLGRQELVVQRLSLEVSMKAQKYTRVGPRKFMQHDDEELKESKWLARNIFHPHQNARGCHVIFWPVSRGHPVPQ